MQSNGIQSSFVGNQMKLFIQLRFKNVINLRTKQTGKSKMYSIKKRKYTMLSQTCK
ncbi:hypothetical protein HanXRQr2_Chr09g0394971 [Helianthus annuus]|uniref:Uncharacterized protein n=1 Tax=Helianthus annuus TaxID=4232 RepID=A0A9K3I732_HELAN|nr:hypothetical protein HanXRQr2_Chr09g0394971 [Helianthus annuus]